MSEDNIHVTKWINYQHWVSFKVEINMISFNSTWKNGETPILVEKIHNSVPKLFINMSPQVDISGFSHWTSYVLHLI